MDIDTVNLARIDMNLLVHLDALLRERSVTRAATRIGIGQSAMSHNLARLRELFGDELLTRGPDGMRLTPRAKALLEPLKTMLAQVEALVSRDQTFDPATAVRTFRLWIARQYGDPDHAGAAGAHARVRARHPSSPLQYRPVAAAR
jgi:DNA-binding transcriptional LysR family regulator